MKDLNFGSYLKTLSSNKLCHKITVVMIKWNQSFIYEYCLMLYSVLVKFDAVCCVIYFTVIYAWDKFSTNPLIL